MKKKKILFTERELICIEQAKIFISTNLKQHLSTEELASFSGINSVTLKYGFRKLYKTSIYQFLLTCRINHAKVLLRNKELQVKAIAPECGFKNVQHFITCFKRREKITPGCYQRKFP